MRSVTSLTIALTFAMATAHAATLHVAADGTGEFSAIEEAIVYAQAGDTVFFFLGPFGGHSLLIDKPLTLQGHRDEHRLAQAT
jgi:hypothetical protein